MKKEEIIERLENIITSAKIQSFKVPVDIRYVAQAGAFEGLLQAFIDELKN